MSRKSISRYIGDELIFSHSIIEKVGHKDDWVHITDTYEILYFVKNNSLYNVEDKTYTINDGSVIISHPGQRHIHSYKEQNMYERYHIRLDSRILPVDLPKLLPNDFCVFSAKDYPETDNFFKIMDTYCQKFEGEVLTEALKSAVINLIFHIISISKSNVSAPDFHTNKILSKVIEYIDRTICEPMNLDKLCSELFVSKSYLHHIFVETLKISPKKYITSKKLYLAQKDIRSGKNPTSVYATYGFSTYSGFYRAYVSHIGYPPSEELRRKDNIIDNFIL